MNSCLNKEISRYVLFILCRIDAFMMDGVFVSLPAPFNKKLCTDIYNNTQYKKLFKSISVLRLRNTCRFITIQHSSLHRFTVWK